MSSKKAAITRRDFIKHNAVATAASAVGMSTTINATNLVTDSNQSKLNWAKVNRPGFVGGSFI